MDRSMEHISAPPTSSHFGPDRRNTAADRAAVSREAAVALREQLAHSRELQLCSVEKIQAEADSHMLTLQQANARLVVAAIEAQTLTEQVMLARVQLDHLAHHDELTGLPNRRLLQDRLRLAMDLAQREGRQLAVLFIDLDQFKHINDSLGHAVGDQLLQSVAKRLATCIRRSDTISRQGGDEFVVLLPHIDRAQDAAIFAGKILDALKLAHPIEGTDPLYVTVSIGISIYPDDGADIETLLRSADIAMYIAKESGRNNYKYFAQDMNARAIQRQSIETGLRRALEQQQFVLHYQPKIDLRSGAIVGVEALIRWQHPEQGVLAPALFVPIAEDCGLIQPIGRWVLREACRQLRRWRQAGLPSIIIGVNASAPEFQSSHFLDNVSATLAETGLEPGCLELELTESVLMHDVAASASVLGGLAKLGVRLSVDDFGTGYSSLSYLRQFPIDTLKIDQSFVSRMSQHPDDATIVSAVISMGKSLNMRVIAEGVETAQQWALLRAAQCDEGQGYYFSRPLTAAAFVKLLKHGVPRGQAH